jgi:alpha-beta hydrolase superfamily lysophospholipase
VGWHRAGSAAPERAVTRLVLKDPLLDFQVLRTAGSAPYGGADLGECIATAVRIKPGNVGSWHDQWVRTADEAVRLAERAQKTGERETARRAYLSASSYYRTAGVMLLSPPLDPRLRETNELQTEMFRRASALMEQPPEILEIPFEQTTLPGYFFRAESSALPRATVILTGGYDSTVEELYFTNAAAALARGYNALAFDGPGQGGALIRQGLTLRPDWENVIRPVLDYALTRADVDPDRVALIGPSLGAHLAPRAASDEHRLAACIADCGAFDLHTAFLRRLPPPLARRVAARNPRATNVLRILAGYLIKKPTGGWALRRGLLVHGLDDPIEFVESLREYTLAGRAERISCPTWVCSAEGDEISESAPELVAALTCEKEYVRFTAAEGAGDHCEAGARILYHARSFAWLDQLLRPNEFIRVASPSA